MNKANIIYKVSPPLFCQSRPLVNHLKRAPLIVRMGTCAHDVAKDPSVVKITWIRKCYIYYNLWDLSIGNLLSYSPIPTLVANERVSLLKLNDMKSYRVLNEMKKAIIDQFYLFNLNHLRKVITKYPTILYRPERNPTSKILESWKQTADKVCDSFKDMEKKITSETQ